MEPTETVHSPSGSSLIKKYMCLLSSHLQQAAAEGGADDEINAFDWPVGPPFRACSFLALAS